jgi:hypothetical protein
MRWTPVFFSLAALAVAACQPSAEDSDAAFTSGPSPDALPAEEVATDASDVESGDPEGPADPAQQSAPPPSETGDMGDARSSEESVEPDSPTMFQ